MIVIATKTKDTEGIGNVRADRGMRDDIITNPSEKLFVLVDQIILLNHVITTVDINQVIRLLIIIRPNLTFPFIPKIYMVMRKNHQLIQEVAMSLTHPLIHILCLLCLPLRK